MQACASPFQIICSLNVSVDEGWYYVGHEKTQDIKEFSSGEGKKAFNRMKKFHFEFQINVEESLLRCKLCLNHGDIKRCIGKKKHSWATGRPIQGKSWSHSQVNQHRKSDQHME